MPCPWLGDGAKLLESLSRPQALKPVKLLFLIDWLMPYAYHHSVPSGSAVAASSKMGESDRDPKWYEWLSKKMANGLRHRATEWGIKVHADGCVDIGEFLRASGLSRHGVVREDVIEVVEQQESQKKKRFALVTKGDGGLYVKATHGHNQEVGESIRAEDLGAEITTVDSGFIFHGTWESSVAQILREGIQARGRAHIHFVEYDPASFFDDMALGRANMEGCLLVGMDDAVAAGARFYRSRGSEKIILSVALGLPSGHSFLPPRQTA